VGVFRITLPIAHRCYSSCKIIGRRIIVQRTKRIIRHTTIIVMIKCIWTSCRQKCLIRFRSLSFWFKKNLFSSIILCIELKRLMIPVRLIFDDCCFMFDDGSDNTCCCICCDGDACCVRFRLWLNEHDSGLVSCLIGRAFCVGNTGNNLNKN
jgi:hypothetical protein